MDGLRLIVGLGNPGREHALDRHNAGFRFVDALADKAGGRFGVEGKLFGIMLSSRRTRFSGSPAGPTGRAGPSAAS